MQPDPVYDHPVAGMHIWGWMSPEELTWLRDTAATMRSVVEVGCLHGRSAFALLTGCPGPVYCIDPWNDKGGHCYPSFMRACGHFPNLISLQGYSPQAAAFVPSVDMVFLDGDHDKGAVLRDIDAWLPKTRRLLCGHDWHDDPTEAGFPGVPMAVEERFAGRYSVVAGTSIWAVML